MTAWVGLDNVRLVLELVGLVAQYRNELRDNLSTIKIQAQAQTPFDAARLAAALNGQAQLGMSTLVTKITALTSDATARAELDDGLQRMGFTRTDLQPAFTALRNGLQALLDAPKTSFAEIIAACDGFLNAIPAARTIV